MNDHDYYGALPERLRRVGADSERSCARCGQRRLPDSNDLCDTCQQDAREDRGDAREA